MLVHSVLLLMMMAFSVIYAAMLLAATQLKKRGANGLIGLSE